MTSVRQQIIDTIVDRIGAIDGVGEVIHALDKSTSISEVIADGKVFIDFSASDDDPNDAASVNGGEASKFDVVVCVHFDPEMVEGKRADQIGRAHV